MTKITFLGSGGGRFMTITQKRGTGGFYVEDRITIHVDLLILELSKMILIQERQMPF